MKESIKNKIEKIIKEKKFSQISKFLRNGQGFCFLGLVCYVHSMETRNSWKSVDGVQEYLGRQAFIPVSVMKWAGLSLEDSKKIARMNDDGISFNRILEEV